MASGYNIAFGNPEAGYFWGQMSDGGIGTLNSTDLGTLNNGIGMDYTCPLADTITHIGYHQGTTTGTPGTNSYTASLQTLTTGGLPSGTNVGGVAGTTFTPTSADDNKWVWVALSSNYTVTQGLQVAPCIVRTAATDASNKITANPNVPSSKVGFPCSVTDAAGTWSRINAVKPLLGMKSASSAYGYPFTGTALATARAFGSTTESGVAFVVPATMCSTYQLRGVRLGLIDPTSSTTNTWLASLYSSPTSSPVLIAQANILTSSFSSSAGTLRNCEIMFTTLATLTSGVEYAIGFATTTASDSSLYSLDVVAAADFNAWDFQQQAYFTTRTANTYAAIVAGNATGNFAHTTTRRVWCDLLLADVTIPNPSLSRSRTY